MNTTMNKKNNKYKNFRFPGQHKDEEIELILRKHLIVLLSHFIYISLMFFLPIAFYIIFVPTMFPAFLNAPYDKLFIILTIIYCGFIWIAIFTIWVDYYLDIWIITNNRLIDIEQIGFFNRVVSELDLKRIQDITSRVHGPLPTMFGFGSIHIQTAAEKSKFDLKTIPHPVTTRRKIIKLYKIAKEKDRLVFRDRDE